MNNNHDAAEEEEARVTAETYGAVSAVDEDVWLLRIPPKLAEAFAAAPEGSVLGDLVFTKGGEVMDHNNNNKTTKKTKMPPSFTVHVAEELLSEVNNADATKNAATTNSNTAGNKHSKTTTASSTAATLPLHYSLQSMTKKVPVLHPMVRHATNGSVQIWGTVSRTANVQVIQDARYRALVKDRLVATNITANRYVRPMENTESVTSRTTKTASSSNATATQAGLQALTGMSSSSKATFGNAVYQFGKRRLEALEQQQQQQQHNILSGAGASKKARQFAPDQPLRSVLFELFAQQPYWAVKDLKAAAVAGGATHAGTRKAETELRDILREIGEYHRSGDHKNMWELRKEFQQG